LINVPVQSKPPLEKVIPIQRAIKETEDRLGNYGRVLVRYSGTESLCRVMVEGSVKHDVEQYAKHLADIVEEELSNKR
jgi:phosphoglucosamine mutase